MNRADRRRWRQAATLADLGELVIAWLNGEVTETPSHGAVPDPETCPLIQALIIVNRGGVTENSQLAEDSWNAWVSGFATDATLARIRAAAAGTRLTVTACRRGEHAGSHRPWRGGCPGRAVLRFWEDSCPSVGRVLRDCWYVTVEDPRPGRNDLLWGTLTAAVAP